MIRLTDATDTRDNQFHSVVVISESKAEYFTQGGEPVVVDDVDDMREALEILGVES